MSIPLPELAWGACQDWRRSRPATWVPARLRAGARLSPEKAGGKSAGGSAPWTPGFDSRSLSLARFGGCGALFRSLGYFGTHLCALIWELSFAKMLSNIFFPKNASQIGFSIPEEIAPLPYQKQPPQKPASGNERLSNPGSRAEPWCSFPRLSSKESRAPARGRAGNHVAGFNLRES